MADVEARLVGERRQVTIARPDANPRASERSAGRTVYRGQNVDDIVTADATSVQFATRIKNRNADETFEYTFDGATSIEVAENGVLVVLDEEGGVLAAVEEPWAVDAGGGAVDTWYEVEGTTVIQHVAHRDGATYPVVADPKVHVGVLLHITLTYSEVKTIYNKLGGAYTSATNVANTACAYLAKASKLAMAVCTVVIRGIAANFWNSISAAYTNKQCLDTAWFPYVPPVLTYWKRVSQSDPLCK